MVSVIGIAGNGWEFKRCTDWRRCRCLRIHLLEVALHHEMNEIVKQQDQYNITEINPILSIFCLAYYYDDDGNDRCEKIFFSKKAAKEEVDTDVPT